MQLRPFLHAAVLTAGIAALSGAAQAATLTHDYELNGSYADALGGPSLVAEGGTLTATDYTFSNNQGLNLTNGVSATDYSIEVNFQFANVNGYRKIVDYQNLASDAGLYIKDSSLEFYNKGSVTPTTITANTPLDVIVTRDGATGTVATYFNGVQQQTFDDSTSGIGIFSTPGALAKFFHDDTHTGGGESSAGSVDYIHVFDGALTSREASDLYTNGIGPISAVPEPSQYAVFGVFVFALSGLMLRARRRAA